MGALKMSMKERRRMELLSRVGEGILTLRKAAGLAKLSYRQMKRIWKRYKEDGDQGLVHRARGRPSNRRKDPQLREALLARYEQRYEDFGPTLASEYLASEGLEVDHETLRRWLLDKGLWKKRRRRKQHRQWRQRRAQRGELVQMDGSHHDWFEGRREWAVLMVMIDDATSRTYARFYEAESTKAAMDVFARYVRRYKLPQALYVDRDSIYRCEREARIDEELRGEGPETQFARAMRQLQVDLILANSPQAKGRVERRNGLFQDRLVKALRLGGISTLREANQYLEKTFLPQLNRRFTSRARQPGDLHRCLPAGLYLKDVLGWQEPRVVLNDWTIRWHNRFFQVHKQHESLRLPGHRIQVFESIDGHIQLRFRGLRLRFTELPRAPVRQLPKPSPKRSKQKPAKTHPWQQSYKGMRTRRIA
jgi:transposase-like protein